MLDFVDDLPLALVKFVRLIFSCRILWLKGKILDSRLLPNELVSLFSVYISLQNISSLTASINENLGQQYIKLFFSILAITSSDIYSEWLRFPCAVRQDYYFFSGAT